MYTMTPSTELRIAIAQMIARARIPSGLRYGLTSFGWRHGVKALADVIDVLERWETLDAPEALNG